MDTKWRRFSRSRAVKVLLVILYIVCFGAAGMIWGYAPAYGYARGYNYSVEDNYGMDAILADDFKNSDYLYDRILRDFFSAEECFKYKYSAEQIEEMLEINQIQARGRLNSVVISSDNYSPDHTFYVDNKGISGDLAVNRDYNIRTDFFENDFIEIGYSDAEYRQMSAYWYEVRRNMTIIIISVIGLVAVGIVFLILSCVVAGEQADGSVSLKMFLKLPYEISFAVFLFSGYILLSLLFGYVPNMGSFCTSYNSRAIYMMLTGLAAAVTFAFLLYLFVSLSVRRKNRCALKGSVIAVICRFVWKILIYFGRQLVRFGRFLKELFTGELYKGKTAARKLLIMDIVFVLVAIALVFVILLSYVGWNYALFIIGIAALVIVTALYIFGRYLILRDGAILENQIKRMHSGEFAAPLHILSKNSPYAASSEMLSEMSEQYRKGIEESVKAERMKMELVTNVSHDLKTPLTSIIGYIELLSKEKLPPEAEEHVKILKSKSERLKNIVSDVFELAKTTSGEITVEREPLDLTKLSYQTLAEMEDKIAAAGFDMKVSICEPPVTVVSDGKRLYRIIQNLLDNALKYSMKGTRIYYTLEVKSGKAYITIKNISAYEMTFTKEEILERFTRGDKARSSEGSGLGLSIAQGFTLACGGQFDIDIDGDLFKAIVSFPVTTVDAEKKTAVTVNE